MPSAWTPFTSHQQCFPFHFKSAPPERHGLWSNNTKTRRAFATRRSRVPVSASTRCISTLRPPLLTYTRRLQRTTYVISRQQIAQVARLQLIHREIAYDYKIYDRDNVHNFQIPATSPIGRKARVEDPRSFGIRTTMHWFCIPHARSLSFLMYGCEEHCTR